MRCMRRSVRVSLLWVTSLSIAKLENGDAPPYWCWVYRFGSLRLLSSTQHKCLQQKGNLVDRWLTRPRLIHIPLRTHTTFRKRLGRRASEISPSNTHRTRALSYHWTTLTTVANMDGVFVLAFLAQNIVHTKQYLITYLWVSWPRTNSRLACSLPGQ